MYLLRLIFFGSLLIFGNTLIAQVENNKGVKKSLKKIEISDSIIFVKGVCKNLYFSFIHQETIRPEMIKQNENITPFITVHGNILYDFSYRSYLDTPFAESNLMQHLVQTNFNFLIKGKYPLKMVLSNRNTNSPYFKNATDIGFQFNQNQLLDNIKSNLETKIPLIISEANLQKEEYLYKTKLAEIEYLKEWVNSPTRMQELVEEKEKQFRYNTLALQPEIYQNNIGDERLSQRKKSGYETKGELESFWKNFNNTKEKKSFFVDSGQFIINNAAQKHFKKDIFNDSSVLKKIEAKKQELTKIIDEAKKYLTTLNEHKKKIQDSITHIQQEISRLKDGIDVSAFIKKNHLDKNDGLTKAQKILLSINKIGLGRSWVDYSELTVKNISLTGVNIEVNPSSYYFAVAVGKLNYRFRDFILKNNKTLSQQSLYLIRAGFGKKYKNNLIFTFYNGKKEVLNNIIPGLASSVQQILGFSAEMKIRLNENNYVITEFAKSSYGNNNNPQLSTSALLAKATDLKVRNNEAFSAKLFSLYPQTNTRITAYYRKMGENFQSFNLYPIGIDQEAWMAKINQSFCKKKLLVEAAIRKNDFVSQVTTSSFSSNTVFKSFQITFKMPNYPFVSVGYFPSSQLSLNNNNILTESQFNTFNTVVSYSYQMKNISMNTNAVYTKFFNNSTDTGFIYFNASSWTLNHSIFLPKLTLQSSLAITDQTDLYLLTLEQQLSYKVKNSLSFTGGIKWNKFNNTENLFGVNAGLIVLIKRLGNIQFTYDKIYLPDNNKKLMPVDIGRMTYYREF